MDIIELEAGWEVLQKSINKFTRILEGAQEEFTSEDYLMVYTTTYNMCNQMPPHDLTYELYNRYTITLEEYMISTVLPALRGKHDEFLLRELVKRWRNNKTMIFWISHNFKYFEQSLHSESLPTAKELGDCFQEMIYSEVEINMKDALIALMDRERDGEQIDTLLLKQILEIFVESGMEHYKTDLEMHMFHGTAAYYYRKAASWIEKYSCSDYMIKAEEYLRREKCRSERYLHVTSETKLLEVVRRELLSQYEHQLLHMEDSGCHALLRNNRTDDLSRMYRLFCKVPRCLGTFSTLFKEYVAREGVSLLNQAEDASTNEKNGMARLQHAQEFMRNVIELHEKYLQCVSGCFANHPIFQKAFKEAFVAILDKGVGYNTSAEMLAMFCDNLIRKCDSENLSDEAVMTIEDMLDKTIKLLAYISDRDLFVEFYRKKLATRLLFNVKCANEEHERSMIAKLKQEYGGFLTSKMEGMMTDLILAREAQTVFKQYLYNKTQSDGPSGIDLTVTVLTTGFWPSHKFSNLRLPSEMVNCVETFKNFYRTNAKHRKLTWITSLGTCNIVGMFESKQIELVVSTYQAAVLLLFNEAERLSYTEIIDQLNLDDEDILVRLLRSLSCGKYRILNKEPSTKNFSQRDMFEFNYKFTDKLRRIKIPLPLGAVDDEKKNTIEGVNTDRRFTIDACICRIMKSRRVLSYNELQLECVAQLERFFKPDFKFIKQRIDDLITREFLERDANNPNMFKYLA